MDVRSFVDELLPALANTGFFDRVTLQTEGPTASGYAYATEGFFLRFYFNEVTGTIAFALIDNQQRLWGIDYDNRRGWHLHPVEDPTDHRHVAPMSIVEIVDHLQEVLAERT